MLFFVFCLLFSCASFLSAEQSNDLSLQQVLSRKLIKSPSRRFTIVGSDVRESLELMNWAEQIAAKVEQAIGIGLPSAKSSIVRIVSRPASAYLPDTGSSPVPPGVTSKLDQSDLDEVGSVSKGSGRVMTTQEFVGGQLVQRLLIYDYDNADPEDALETLCHLLLNSYVVARGTKAQRDKGTEDGKQTTDNGQRTTDSRIPYWLVVGMAQNLYPSRKAWNSEVVLRRWQEGQLLPLAQFLRSAGTKAQRHKGTEGGEKEDSIQYPDKAVCGLLLGWIRSLPNGRECFEKIFERLAVGKDISPEWFVTCIPACDSIADLEEEWDNWILRQKQIVYELGTITSGLIDQLKAELLLYPGDFGIPLTSNLDQWIEFRDLIEQRDASWIPAFSSSKGMSLRLLAAGRGKEFGDVVDSYCRFLEALRRGKSRRKLEKLLNKADQDLERLRRELEKGRSGETETGR